MINYIHPKRVKPVSMIKTVSLVKMINYKHPKR